jgi:hypothetical protein
MPTVGAPPKGANPKLLIICRRNHGRHGLAAVDCDKNGSPPPPLIQSLSSVDTQTRDPAMKTRLLEYNEDDCRAMRVVMDAMRRFPVLPSSGSKVSDAQKL